MNRRELLERLAAIPLVGRAFPAGDGVALTSCAHPETATPSQQGELRADSLETIELDVPDHEFAYNEVCVHCGASAQAIENGDVPLACWSRLAAERHKALVQSMSQTWNEALEKMPWPW